MVTLHIDLDNTLIYSGKKIDASSPEWVCVEKYQGRDLCYMTKTSIALLEELSDRVNVVPTTTRTFEQYSRIDLGFARIHHALLANGGILIDPLMKEIDKDWQKRSEYFFNHGLMGIQRAMNVLKDPSYQKEYLVTREPSLVEDLFIFTKSSDPKSLVCDLKKILKHDPVDVFSNFQKVYVIPEYINKGIAVKRYSETFPSKTVFCAGDSDFDVPMAYYTNKAFVPHGFSQDVKVPNRVQAPSDEVFSDFILKSCLSFVKDRKEVISFG